jgi:hypothetical protein
LGTPPVQAPTVYNRVFLLHEIAFEYNLFAVLWLEDPLSRDVTLPKKMGRGRFQTGEIDE